MLLAAALVLELARESLTGTHCRYRQYVDGLPTDEYVTRPCGELTITTELLTPVALRAESLRSVEGRVARRVVVEEAPLQPFAHDYDVITGQLLRRIPLFYRGKPARVFDPNPVVTMNDPSLQDRNDRADAVPLSAYFDVELNNTFPSGSLAGPYVTLADRQPPAIAPPDSNGSLVFNREENGFEDVNAYFHIDRAQHYLQALGYTGARGVAAYSIPVDAHAASGADNSFFLPSGSSAGRGSLFFGEGGTDDAEDADLLIHEYTHAIHEWIAPGTFGGSFVSEARALAEGMADYWAYSTHAQARRVSGRDPFCFADWDARCGLDDASQRCSYGPDADCLRRLDSTTTMAGYVTDDAQGVEHRNGAIWSSALREIHDRIGKQVTDTILIESLFGTPPRPTFAVMGLRMIEADRLLHQGLYASAICSAMYSRGILERCDVLPRGEWTHLQSRERGLVIPENNSAGVTSTIRVTDPRAIAGLQVRVDIEHPSRGDLRIVLIAPDDTAIVLHDVSNDRTSGIHATYGLNATPIESLEVLRGRSAAGEWTLAVSDRRPLDVGTLQSWGLAIRFAGDAPLTVRPRGATSQMIPVVGHLYGAGATLYQSDVRIANASEVDSHEATLIFTRSGEDGVASFASVRLSLAPGQTLAFDDVLDTIFSTAGTGSLEVLGEVLVSSRTFLRRADTGTLGQLVPSDLETTTLGGPPLLVAPIPSAPSRVNLGLTESAGARGVVRAGGREIAVQPYSHVQIPVAAELQEIRVIEGAARVSAYLSQIEPGGDAMFLPAESAVEPRSRSAPVISTNEPASWRSDLWVASRVPGSLIAAAIPGGSAVAVFPALFDDVLTRLFPGAGSVAALQVAQPANTYAATRITFAGTTQFVPLLDASAFRQDLLFVESSEACRTNIGIVAAGPAVAEVRVLDATGAPVETFVLRTEGGVAQVPVSAAVVHGRAVVTFLEGTGRGYASLIDRRSLDATYVGATKKRD